MKRICEPVCEKTRKRNLALKRVKVMLQLRHRWENGLRYTQDKKFLHALAKNFYYAKIFSLLLCKKNQSSSSSSQRPTQRTVNKLLTFFAPLWAFVMDLASTLINYHSTTFLSFWWVTFTPTSYLQWYLPTMMVPTYNDTYLQWYLPTMIPTYNNTYLQWYLPTMIPTYNDTSYLQWWWHSLIPPTYLQCRQNRTQVWHHWHFPKVTYKCYWIWYNVEVLSSA